MDPVDQQIAIAEACRWKRHKTRFGHEWESPDGRRGYVTRTEDEGGDYHLTCPDYLTDLNAMHVAVMEKRDELGGYCMELRRIVRRDTPGEYDVYGDINYYHATAAQRAEAFLKTLGKWT